MLDDFHFLRPLWLFLLLVIPILVLLLLKVKNSNHQWKGIVDKDLLSHLIVGDNKKASSSGVFLLAIIWLITSIGLAGPSWQKLPQTQYVNQQPLVMLVDLSPSMQVEDVKPSRLVKMRFKLIDFLKERKQGLTALVAYAGDAHVLAPLSDDTKTLVSLIPTLSPGIMPVSGSKTEEGITLAISLIKEQGYKNGDIVLFTDGITATAEQNLQAILEKTNIRLSIVGIGTKEGAPIPTEQGFAKDASGNIVLARLNSQQLQKIAQKNQGVYTNLTLSNQDLEQILELTNTAEKAYKALKSDDSEMDQWVDAGQWLVLLLIPLCLLGFRKGMLLQFTLVSLLGFSLLNSKPVMAFEWDDLWLSSNQQGAKAFKEQNFEKATQAFNDLDWKSSAQYKNKNYAQAAENFAKLNSADGFYNQGNALAQMGQLENAILAYDKALLLAPNMQDASANKTLVEKLLEQKKAEEKDQSQQQNKDQQQQKSDQNKQDSDSKDSSEGKEPSADKEPSEGKEPSADKKPSANKEPSANKKPSADENQNSSDKDPKDASKEDQKQSSAKQQQLEDLKKAQRQKEQQAIAQSQQKNKEQQQPEESPESAMAQSAELSPEQQLKNQQLDNWLGQLPEDASRLMRNKFNYEYQKKRQAYMNGQWQPAKEQRW